MNTFTIRDLIKVAIDGALEAGQSHRDLDADERQDTDDPAWVPSVDSVLDTILDVDVPAGSAIAGAWASHSEQHPGSLVVYLAVQGRASSAEELAEQIGERILADMQA